MYKDEVERENEGDDAVYKADDGDDKRSTYSGSLRVFDRIRCRWSCPWKVDEKE